MSISMLNIIRENGILYENKVAFIFEGKSITYGELDQQTNIIANSLLDMGFKRGDRIAIYLHNCVEYILMFYGAAKLGLVIVPINPMLKKLEIEHMLEESEASILLTRNELFQPIESLLKNMEKLQSIFLVDGIDCNGKLFEFQELFRNNLSNIHYSPESTDNMCIFYSSGTTGRPKGSLHTHSSIALQGMLSSNIHSIRRSDVFIHGLPLCHVFANVMMNSVIAAGCTMVIAKEFNAEKILYNMSKYSATIFAGTPIMFKQLLDLSEHTLKMHPINDLEISICGGSSLSSQLQEDFTRKFGSRVLNSYGASEAGGIAVSGNYLSSPSMVVNFPYPQSEIKIIDKNNKSTSTGEVGELIVKSPQIMKKYWKNPEKTELTIKDGYLYTGDLAYKDDRGIIHLVDRINDTIISGGYNIFPTEVEDVICLHKKVAACCVFGVNNGITEVPWVAVIPEAEEQIKEEEIIYFCLDRLAVYKCPRKVLIVKELPKNSLGKVLRRSLSEKFSK